MIRYAAALFALVAVPAFGQVQIVSLVSEPSVIAHSLGTPTTAPDLGDSDCYCGETCDCANCDCFLCPHKPAKKVQTVLKPVPAQRLSGPAVSTPSPRPASKLPAVAWHSPQGSGSPIAPGLDPIDLDHSPAAAKAAPASRAGASSASPPARPFIQAPVYQQAPIVCYGGNCQPATQRRGILGLRRR